MGRGGKATLAVAATCLSACGGGAPLLYPAHTLTRGEVTFAAGTSGRLTVGALRDAERDLDASAALPGGATTEAERNAFIKGAAARFAVAPGVAPFVAGRVGLGNQNEAGLTYTGRGLRLDGRHAFEWPKLALSVGAGATAALARPGKQPEAHVGDMPGSDSGLRTVTLTSLSGYGLELPVLFGYRSDADVVKAWVGLRAGFERDQFDVALVESPDTPLGSTGEATRYWGGGLVGFAVGLSPIEVRVEIDGDYQSARGKLRLLAGDLSGRIEGWSLTPAMAISAKF